MYNFSIHIGDDIASDLFSKVKACNELCINNMEINDSINETDIAEMSGAELEKARGLLIDYNKKVVLINSLRPVSDIEGYKLLFRKANVLRAENIKVSACNFIVEPLELTNNLQYILKIGKSYGIKVILENQCDTILSTDKKLTEIYSIINDEGSGLAFNPLEYSREKRHPFFNEFYNSKLKSKICFLRVNDGLFLDGSPSMPGCGNAEIKEMASILLSRGFKGYFSFIPYFDNMDINSYKEVILRFKNILKEL